MISSDLDDGGRRGHEKKLFKRWFRLDTRKFVSSNRVDEIGIHYLHSVLIDAQLTHLRSIFQFNWSQNPIIIVFVNKCDIVESRRYRHVPIYHHWLGLSWFRWKTASQLVQPFLHSTLVYPAYRPHYVVTCSNRPHLTLCTVLAMCPMLMPTTPWVKKQNTELLPITSPNMNRFSNFFSLMYSVVYLQQTHL